MPHLHDPRLHEEDAVAGLNVGQCLQRRRLTEQVVGRNRDRDFLGSGLVLALTLVVALAWVWVLREDSAAAALAAEAYVGAALSDSGEMHLVEAVEELHTPQEAAPLPQLLAASLLEDLLVHLSVHR